MILALCILLKVTKKTLYITICITNSFLNKHKDVKTVCKKQ